MGVYIKGMEMPKDCLHCCFVSGCSYCEGYNDHCAFEPDDIKTDWDFDHGVFPGSIPDWCPLVPVQPHGRLIDADALEQAVNDFPYGYRGMILAEVAIAPTIIPESKEN